MKMHTIIATDYRLALELAESIDIALQQHILDFAADEMPDGTNATPEEFNEFFDEFCEGDGHDRAIDDFFAKHQCDHLIDAFWATHPFDRDRLRETGQNAVFDMATRIMDSDSEDIEKAKATLRRGEPLTDDMAGTSAQRKLEAAITWSPQRH